MRVQKCHLPTDPSIKTIFSAATVALGISFAQQPDSESEFQRKLDAMQSECQRIAVAVPCAVLLGIAKKAIGIP
jgi:hypothetical protein